MTNNFELGDSVVVYERDFSFEQWKVKDVGYIVAKTENSIKIRQRKEFFWFFDKTVDAWVELAKKGSESMYRKVEKISE